MKKNILMLEISMNCRKRCKKFQPFGKHNFIKEFFKLSTGKK